SEVNYSDSIILGRILDDEGHPVAGVSSTVYAYYDGAWHEVGVATTDSDGWAELNVFLSPGSYTVNVTFPGDAYYESGWQNATLTVHRESIVLEITAPSSVYVDQTAQLGVRVTDDEGNAISGLYVEFYLNGAFYANGTTDSNGELSADWTPLETATYSLEVRVSGGDNYVDGTATKSMSVVKPPPPLSSLPLLLLLVSQSAGGVSPVIIFAAAGLVGIAIIVLLIRAAATRRGPVRWTPRY
ncbi:MAG: Ig-like domain-containing protein, partial [Candidatus Freyarchaeota archaeon]